MNDPGESTERDSEQAAGRDASSGRGADRRETRIRVTAGRAGMRADAFLSLEFPFLSRTRVRQKIQTGESLLNGRRYASSARMREGDEVTVRWRSDPGAAAGAGAPVAADAVAAAADAVAGELSVAVLYEDEFLMAVDKPAGVAAHPAGGEQSATLIQRARTAFAGRIAEGLARGDASFYPSLVNRIDRYTSGIVLIAKTRETLLAMHRLAAAGGISKEYTAVVEGVMEGDSGRLDEPIGPEPGNRIGIKMAVRPDGRPSVTLFTVIRRLPGHTLVSARPLTGRTHQIRVHMAAAGHPVWGDLLYKDEAMFLRYWESRQRLEPGMPPRHLLHAGRATFMHPMTGRPVEIVSPLPPSFLEILAELESATA